MDLAIFAWVAIVAVGLGLSSGASPSAWVVGNLLFDYWVPFGLLLAIYHLGAEKERGLWSSAGSVEANYLPLNDVGRGHVGTDS